ncbi:BNR-4 repeat-containing protein [Pseudoalteromonas luteoviolacea]|uniref:BNR-4 repeat-containing protein n=1 Tax=Pseudoalteromonas luteoviolacea TaxID=43657 RepID=UPI001B38547C|nr:BNR-4 repeat-containing protein [Pseudoalteromonas luteoviolacea]MBQ4811790.1 BNR-4 repeat-containing protein [Pseudoalteromonas luteoviolacea]
MLIKRVNLIGFSSALMGLSLSFGAAAAEVSPWDDQFNVYKYLKKADGRCLYPKQSCSSLDNVSVTQFKKVNHFNGDTFGLNQLFAADVNGDGVNESVPKYSGNLSTYTTKHYPMAVKHSNGLVYFTYSGPVKLDGTSTYASTAGQGQTTTPTKFLDPRGKSRALGIYVAKYDPRTDKVSKPVLVHAKYTDDPHDNAVVNIDDKGYVYVLIAGRGQSRGAFLYKSTTPGSIDAFSDITPDNYDYTSFDSRFGRAGIAYPKLFWVDSDGGYFRLIYTVYCSTPDCGKRNVFTAKLNVDGSKARLEEVVRVAGFKGHYSIANAKGNDIVMAFNVHLNNSVDHRTNLYYMHSNDGGKTWKNAHNQSVVLPMLTSASLDQVAVREYYHNGQTIGRRIYVKDINFSGTGNSKKPMILYVGVVGNNGYIPSTTADHYLAKAFYDGSNWSQARISNDVDNNYSSGALISDGSNSYDVYFPGTPEAHNNALGGGAIAKTFTVSGWNQQYAANYITPSRSASDYRTPADYLKRMCDFNYVRPIHGNTSKTGLIGISAAGNPYQYSTASSASPIVMVKHNQIRMLPHSFSDNQVINGFVATEANPQLLCDPHRDL